MNNEFYVGWMPKAPASFVKHIRKVLLVLLVAVSTIGILLGMSQKKFSTGNFEFGKLTEVKGIYFSKPIPSIKVINGKDIFGRLSYIIIPLVGFGKMGAEGVISNIETEQHVSLHQKEISLKGTLLYDDGKLLMQVDSNDKPLVHIGHKADASLLPVEEDLGDMQIRGEIIDPKCYFGVMKPGQGKPHKDCAIRCILGGIPPVMRVTNDNGAANYYLLTGANGERMNEAVKNFVAEPVVIHARAVKWDDWIILYVHPVKGIERYSYVREKFGNTVQYCERTCTK
jgi:hypothetical protein